MPLNLDLSRDELIKGISYKRLKESYMRDEEVSPQERFAYVSEAFASNPAHAQRIYDYASKHWLSFPHQSCHSAEVKKGFQSAVLRFTCRILQRVL